MRNRTTRYLTGANPKLVQSWNKYNLYHLKHLRLPPNHTKTFFQQKWAAKSLTRAYHGEQVRESQWERMFSRRLRGVVPMTAAYLGENDGSRESAGRGAGLDQKGLPAGSVQGLSLASRRQQGQQQLPWMQMTYAPLERRLDVAVFRALFASSARQARQFVVHGGVTVNGKKMRFPGYLLNPGDMFQVDPELVMYATGAPKTGKQRRGGRQRRVKAKERREKEAQAAAAAESAEQKVDEKADEKPAAATTTASEAKNENGQTQTEEQQQQQQPQPAEEGKEDHEAHRASLMELLGRAKEITNATAGTNRPHKHRADFTEFRRLVRSALSKTTAHAEKGQDIHDLEAQFARLTMLVDKENAAQEAARKAAKKEEEEAKVAGTSTKSTSTTTTSFSSSSPSSPAGDPTAAKLESALMTPDSPSSQALLSSISPSDLQILKQALYQVHENPIDTSKPYATPWRPRDYMSAFAFIPRYLEVNQNICAAVYVRHPVVRPGLAEVPTPFPETFSQAAFGWYLRRR